jgi:hypothetical protein
MRTSGVVAICLVGGLLSGCGEEDKRTAANQRFDREMVPALNNLGVENAIVTQHTLYPYHFVVAGEKLNDLGQRDFAVLARHFTEHPGLLNVRRGEGISPELYQARIAWVTSRLKEAGIDPARVTISDGMPGGPGLPSERVVTILQKTEDVSTKSYSRDMITQ